MLKFHSVIRPTATESFFEQSVDMWLGFDSGHMGPQMYQHHKGKRLGQSVSGVLTWDEHAKQGTIPQQCRASFLTHIQDVANQTEKGIPVVEFGPGSMEDAKVLIEATHCKEYIPVDCSLGIINQASALAADVNQCAITPAVINFFSEENCPLIDTPALGVFLGLTITNVPGPVPRQEPRGDLIKAFRNLTKAIPHGGYLLVSTDVCQDAARNKALYSEPWHKLFGVNHIYRMAEELPMRDFDPDGFEYQPVWHEHCSLLAHTVIATKNQNFCMEEDGEILVSVKTGYVFHYNNSFKYRPDLFEACAEDAGLEVIQSWQDDSSIRLYLFHVPPRDARNSYKAPARFLSSAYASNRLAIAQEKLRAVG